MWCLLIHVSVTSCQHLFSTLCYIGFRLLAAFWCHQSYPVTQMLSRAASDASIRLRRSKSTSTVHRHPAPIHESLDPEAAKEQALAAAIAAFARAQAQDAVDRTTKRSSELARSKSNASRKSGTMQGQGSHFPARGSSFRSVQSHSTGPGAASQRPSRAPAMNTEAILSTHPTPTDRPVSAPKPLSAQPSIAFRDQIRPSTQPKPGRQGISSSITSQQIRKARSMYYASSVQTGSPIARPPTMYLTTPPAVPASSKTELPTTVPAARTLGPSPLAEPRIPVVVAADESIDKARDSYLQSFQQRSIKHKPSLFLAPFIKRQDRGKDKSKRISSTFTAVSTSSQYTPCESTVDVSLNDFMPQGDKKDKRSISSSLKSRIKKVFRRSSRPSPRLPVQQIQASRDYFDTDPTADVQDAGDLYAIPSPEDEMLQRVRARTPSLEPTRPIFGRSGSRTSSNGSVQSGRSNRSLHSEVHSTNPSVSRMTSWGTTATEDTLAQRAIKRLTVIHESKDSIGSEADRAVLSSTKRKSLPAGALASFRDPMPMESLMEENSTVDPKRVFSALMKEINASKPSELAADSAERTPGAESDVFESKETKILHSGARELHPDDFCSNTVHDQRPPSRRAPSAAAQSTQSKTSSFRILGRAIRSTIRTVTPGEHESSPCPDRPPSDRGVAHIPAVHVQASSGIITPDTGEDCMNIGKRSDQMISFQIGLRTE
jgi:hypothetical protein